jgi:predicted ribonuclease YlaK
MRARPVSTTKLILGIVRDVSATFVATIILRWGEGSKILSCSQDACLA